MLHPSMHSPHRAFITSTGVGGLWRYDDTTPMYECLRTNLPKFIMNFADFPFPSSIPTYPHRSAILQYYDDYANHHNLLPLIRFSHPVKKVEPIQGDKGWMVDGERYDAVIVCNGHYNTPRMPDCLKGIGSKKHEDGKRMVDVIHSKFFREPSPWKGKRVLVVGAGSSGIGKQASSCPQRSIDLASRSDPRPPQCRFSHCVGRQLL